MGEVPYKQVLKALPELIAKAEGDSGPVLKLLRSHTIIPDLPAAKLETMTAKDFLTHQDRLLGQIRDMSLPISAKYLMSKGLSSEEAFGRAASQAQVALGRVPEALQPKKNLYELTRPDLPAGTPIVDPIRQLKVGETARQVTRAKGLARWMNPAYRGEHVFGAAANPALDVADAVAHWQANTSWWSKTLGMSIGKLRDVRKDPEFLKDMTEGFKKAKPLMDKMDDLFTEKYKLERQLKLMKPSPRMGLKKLDIKKIDEQLAHMEQAVRDVNVPLMQKWANKSASVRIMLGLEDDRYPWINALLHPEEKATRDSIRKSLDLIMERSKELGLNYVSRDKYAPHSMGRILRTLEKENPQLAATFRYHVLPEKLRWAQRSAGSWQFWPAVHSLPRYYADSHRILSMTPVLSKWTPILKQMHRMGLKNDAEFFTNWLSDLAYGERLSRGMDKFVDWLVGVEYMDKVGLSFSTALKHSIKALKGFAFHPIYYSKGALKALNEGGEYVGRKFTGNLERSGVNPDNYARFARYYLQSRALFRGFSGIDPGKGLAKYVLNTTLAQPTATVEAFERFSVMSGMMMKGMAQEASMGRALQQMWHSLIDVSFIGQVDRYTWLKSPLQRFLMLFYYTPLRVTEQSLKTLAYAALPEKFVTKTAANALQTAAHMRTDPLGGTYMGKLVRAALVIGGAEALARAHDSSIYEWATFHVPFIRESRTGDPEFVLPPVIDFAQKLNRLGWTAQAFMAALMSHYGAYSVQRLVRMSDVDRLVPAIYKPPGSSDLEQKLRAFFVLPSLEAMEIEHAKHAPRVMHARQQYYEILKRQGRWHDIFWEAAINALNYTGGVFTLPDGPSEEQELEKP